MIGRQLSSAARIRNAVDVEPGVRPSGHSPRTSVDTTRIGCRCAALPNFSENLTRPKTIHATLSRCKSSSDKHLDHLEISRRFVGNDLRIFEWHQKAWMRPLDLLMPSTVADPDVEIAVARDEC